MKYLNVEFGDNDFGWNMMAALKQLWHFIDENNGHMLRFTNDKSRTIPQIFFELHKLNLLEPMLKRLFVIDTLTNSVEVMTRGLYDHPPMYEKLPSLLDECKNHDYYLSCFITFHETDDFTKQCQNSECAWLNLNTGDVDTF